MKRLYFQKEQNIKILSVSLEQQGCEGTLRKESSFATCCKGDL